MRGNVMRFEVGNRVIVMERGRMSVGNIVEVSGDEAQPQFTVQFGEFRTVVFNDKSLLRYTAARWDSLNNAIEMMFAGYRAEDAATAAAPSRAKATRTRTKAAE